MSGRRADRSRTLGLVTVGAGRRMAGAALIAAALWLGFFWAIGALAG